MSTDDHRHLRAQDARRRADQAAQRAAELATRRAELAAQRLAGQGSTPEQAHTAHAALDRAQHHATRRPGRNRP